MCCKESQTWRKVPPITCCLGNQVRISISTLYLQTKVYEKIKLFFRIICLWKTHVPETAGKQVVISLPFTHNIKLKNRLLMRISFYIISYQIRKQYKNIRNLLKSPQGEVGNTVLVSSSITAQRQKHKNTSRKRRPFPQTQHQSRKLSSLLISKVGLSISQSEELPLGTPKLLWKLFST